MRALIVSTAEQFPCIDGDVPSWRTNEIIKEFRARGVDVTLVTGRFNHYTKTMRKNHATAETIFLRSVPYTSNISVMRIINYLVQTLSLIKTIKAQRPDLVLITVPALEHLIACLVCREPRYIIDFRDLWPEIFQERLGPAWSFILFPYFQLRKSAGKVAKSIWTISPMFRGYIIDKFPCSADKVKWFPHPKSREWVAGNDLGEPSNSECLSIVYCGMINKRTGVIAALQALSNIPTCFRFVLAGYASSADEALIRSICKEDTRVEYLGVIPSADVIELYRRADYGLLPYLPSLDFDMSFPNKFLEYLSHGLKVISTDLRQISETTRGKGIVVPLSEVVSTAGSNLSKTAPGEKEAISMWYAEVFSRETMHRAVCEACENLRELDH